MHNQIVLYSGVISVALVVIHCTIRFPAIEMNIETSKYRCTKNRKELISNMCIVQLDNFLQKLDSHKNELISGIYYAILQTSCVKNLSRM